jgi:hypothetical protein
MHSERRKEMYRGYEIVARFDGETYKGKAWPKEAGLDSLSDQGENLDDVVDKLCKRVDVALQPRTVEWRKTLPERHSKYLIELGKPDAGLRQASQVSPHRESVCYRCGEPVDNRVDLECTACGWIVCHSCAACGCGHEASRDSST